MTNCHRLKFEASDGKFYVTDAADVEVIFRLIQSVPSPKAEPIKGGRIAKNARLELEQKTGKKVVNGANFLQSVKGRKKIN